MSTELRSSRRCLVLARAHEASSPDPGDCVDALDWDEDRVVVTFIRSADSGGRASGRLASGKRQKGLGEPSLCALDPLVVDCVEIKE